MDCMLIYAPGAPVVFARGRRARCGRSRFCRMFLMDSKKQKKWVKYRDGEGVDATEIRPVMIFRRIGVRIMWLYGGYRHLAPSGVQELQ